MDGYEEFQRIMAEINRKKELDRIKNGGDDSSLNYLKDLFGI